MGEILTLWIVRGTYSKLYDNTQRPDEYCYVYASNKEQARTKIRNWIDFHPQLTEHHFTPHPEGFVIGGSRHLPGHIEVAIVNSNTASNQ